jgi:hypothetical protein
MAVVAGGCGEVETAESGTLSAGDVQLDSLALADLSTGTDAGAVQTDVAELADTALQDNSEGSDAAVPLDEADDTAGLTDTAEQTDVAAATDAAATDAQVTPDLPPAGTDAAIAADATDPCIAPRAAFEAASAAAQVCSTPFDCFALALTSADCTCQHHVNGVNPAVVQSVSDTAKAVAKANCKQACYADCLDLTTTVGVCSSGKCSTQNLTCSQLDQAASLALAEGAKCSADADCKFKVSNTLGCGCASFVNVTTMGPGKPLFSYMMMLVTAYKAKGCTSDVACECPPAESAICQAGKCVIK